MAEDLDLSNIGVAIIEFDSHGHMTPIALSADSDLIRETAKKLVAELQEHEGKPTARGAMATARIHILRSLAGANPRWEVVPVATPAWWPEISGEQAGNAITETKEDQSAQS